MTGPTESTCVDGPTGPTGATGACKDGPTGPTASWRVDDRPWGPTTKDHPYGIPPDHPDYKGHAFGTPPPMLTDDDPDYYDEDE